MQKGRSSRCSTQTASWSRSTRPGRCSLAAEDSPDRTASSASCSVPTMKRLRRGRGSTEQNGYTRGQRLRRQAAPAPADRAPVVGQEARRTRRGRDRRRAHLRSGRAPAANLHRQTDGSGPGRKTALAKASPAASGWMASCTPRPFPKPCRSPSPPLSPGTWRPIPLRAASSSTSPWT